MKAGTRYLALAIGLLLLAGSIASSKADIRIYRTTFSGKAAVFPRRAPNGNSQFRRGYLVYDSNNPANSQTIEVFPNRTYQVNGTLLNLIFPSQIGLAPFDRNNDTTNETELALVGFTSGGDFRARLYRGAIPRFGIRLQGQTFFGTSRFLRGVGSDTVFGVDHFRVTNILRLDARTGALPGNTNAGVLLVTADLAGRGFTQVP